MEDFIKSWKTTVLGVIILGMSIYHYFSTGEDIDWASTVSLLIGIGFLFSKDNTDSHTKR